jgi:hypothetical protein
MVLATALVRVCDALAILSATNVRAGALGPGGCQALTLGCRASCRRAGTRAPASGGGLEHSADCRGAGPVPDDDTEGSRCVIADPRLGDGRAAERRYRGPNQAEQCIVTHAP